MHPSVHLSVRPSVHPPTQQVFADHLPYVSTLDRGNESIPNHSQSVAVTRVFLDQVPRARGAVLPPDPLPGLLSLRTPACSPPLTALRRPLLPAWGQPQLQNGLPARPPRHSQPQLPAPFFCSTWDTAK